MIELQNLSAGYGSRPILTEISLDFRPGEVLVCWGLTAVEKAPFCGQQPD